MASKKHVTLRLDEDVLVRLDTYAEGHGISRTEAVERALVSLFEGTSEGRETVEKPLEDEARTETGSADLRAVCDVLRASNADLRAEVSRLWSQLATKDEQIRTAQSLADHAQQLHAAEVTRALPAEVEETKTLRQRLAAIFGRKGE